VNALEQGLTDYLRIRRSLGFQLRKVERCLRSFVAFLQVEGASYITTELALCWTTTQFAKVLPSTRAERLGMVRRFASWHSATEPRTEIPPAELLPHRYRRKPPHIYSDEEIEGLLRQAQQLPSSKGLRARTFTTLFGLLAVTGLAKPWVWTDRMSTSIAASFTSGGESGENRVTCRFIPPPWSH
jgi:integrase/recombinase XerD